MARQSAAAIILGTIGGLALAWLVARTLVTLLFGVRAFDPETLLCAIAVLTVSAFLASLIPALSATKVQPLAALRHE
jgi:ABC-type antimicrobial peptide transport system permease subunit